jgi:transposase
MTQEPYASAKRVFWVVDNGSSHRGETAMKRLAKRWPNLILVHLPIHASWLNQIEIYFSILQRKVLNPNDLDSLFALEDRILPARTVTRLTPNRSSGSSHARTYPSCSLNSPSKRRRNRIRHRICEWQD